MELRDLIVTPLLIVIVYIVAYLVRPLVTDSITRKYFFPALTVRVIGALAVGFIYQFYYQGGDTFNYHTHGSRHIWEAFFDSPEKAWKIFANSGFDFEGIYDYAIKIIFFQDPSSFTIVRLSFLFDIFTFSTYSSTAIFFAIFSLTGMWFFFMTFYKQYPHLHFRIALASLFIPSTFFWGSGLMKDTITLGALGAGVYMIHQIFILRSFKFFYLLILLLSVFLLYQIKVYILLVFLPAVIVWILFSNLNYIKSKIARLMLFPFVTLLAIVLGYFAVLKAGEDNAKYSVENLSKTAQITAYDIRYWTGRDAGSGYTLGELDGSFESMIRLAPQAINVTLFRPFLWEVDNPLMLFAALESFVFLLLTGIVFLKSGFRIFFSLSKPNILFLLLFAVIFSFAVGVSTFNFGTLARYKIPMLPFFCLALFLILDQEKSRKKLSELADTE